jgi:hypothetical protein
MICTFVRHRVLRKLEKHKLVSRADVGEQDSEYTYPKGIRDHKLAFVCKVGRKVSENKSTSKNSVKKSRKSLSGLPSHTPPDTSGGNNAIRKVPCTVGKVPSMASCIVDDYSVVDTLVDTSGYMNVQRNKGGHTGVDI